MSWNTPDDWNSFWFTCNFCRNKYHQSEGHNIEDCYGNITRYAEYNFENYLILDGETFATFDGDTVFVYEWDEVIEKIPEEDLDDYQIEKYKEILEAK